MLDQHPRSGVQADEGSEITLTISRVEATVPRVAGFTVDEAKARLARVGFGNVVVTEEDRDDVQPGTVLRSTPEVGLRADKLAAFTLVVARDPYVVLPASIVNVDEAKFIEILQSLGLQGKRETATSKTAPAGIVLSVSPGVGQSIRRGSFVSYKVSTGPKLVAVPQVTQRVRRRRGRRARRPGIHGGGGLRRHGCVLSREGGLAGPQRGHRAGGVDGDPERRQVVSLPG